MAISVSGRSRSYSSGVQKRSGTAAVYNKSKAAGLVVDTADGYTLKYNKNGTVVSVQDTSGTVPTTVNIGANNGSTVSVVESGGAFYHQTVLTFTATPLALSDTNVGGGVLIYTFPVGAITILGAVGSIAEKTTSTLSSTLNTGVTYNWGVGSVITTTQGSGTLATTEQDIIPTTNGTASATINVAGAVSKGIRVGNAVAFNGNSSAVVANLNIGIATGTDIDGDATTTITGSVTISWLFGGAV